MPITARLSRTLHVTLGEDAGADMMTWMQSVDDHRSELRELNELTMSRLEGRFAQVDVRFAQVDVRFAQVDARFAQVEAHFGEIDARFGQMDERIEKVASRLEGKIDQRFADLIKWSFVFWCGAVAVGMLSR